MTIWCVGRNYVDHARELSNPIPQEPLIFIKSAACLYSGETIELPGWVENMHHEVEMALRIGPGRAATEAAVAIDLTERDIQSRCKSLGHPWTLAKSFPASCPIGDFVPCSDFDNLDLELSINGQLKQRASTSEMIFNTTQIIDYIKKFFPLREGDIVLCGTPAGVGPVLPGDKISARLADFSIHNWTVKRS